MTLFAVNDELFATTRRRRSKKREEGLRLFQVSGIMRPRRWCVPRPPAATAEPTATAAAAVVVVVVLQRLIDFSFSPVIQSNTHFLLGLVSGGSRAARMASSNTFFKPFCKQ